MALLGMLRRKRRDLSEILPQQNKGSIPSDVLGSYTGEARDGSRPVQDADDL